MPNDEVLELPTKRVNKKPKNEAVGPRVDGNGKPCPYITHEELLMLGNARKTAEAPHMTPDNAKLPAILLCPPADFASAEEQDAITESSPSVQNAPETAKLPVMQDAAAEAPLAHQGPSIPESSVEQGGLPETEATESIQVRPSEQDTAKRSPSVEGGQPAPSAGEE